MLPPFPKFAPERGQSKPFALSHPLDKHKDWDCLSCFDRYMHIAVHVDLVGIVGDRSSWLKGEVDRQGNED